MPVSLRVFRKSSLISVGLAAALVCGAQWQSARAASIDLGEAANYAVFGFNGVSITDADVSINSTAVTGSVAIGPNNAGAAFASQMLRASPVPRR